MLCGSQVQEICFQVSKAEESMHGLLIPLRNHTFVLYIDMK